MCKIFITLTTVVLLAGWCIAAPLPRAAVLADDNPGSMANEPDLIEGFERIDKYHIKDLDRLSRELEQYAIVILTTGANYEADRNFNEFGETWRRYVAGGGMVLAFDANYPATSDRVMAPFPGESIPFAWEICQISSESYSDGGLAGGREILLGEPAALTGYFPRLRSWQHFRGIPAGWQPMIVCKHGQPLMLERRYGKGRLIVSNYYGLYSIVGKEFVRDLVRDLVFHQAWEYDQLQLIANEAVFDAAGFHWHGTVHTAAPDTPDLAARILDASGNELACTVLNFDAAGNAAYRFDLFPVDAEVTAVIESAQSGITPYRRIHPVPDRRIRWHMPARLQPGQLSRIRIQLDNLGGRACTEAGIRVDDTVYPAMVTEDGLLRSDLSGVAPGEHQVSLILDREETQTQRFVVTAPDMHITIDENGWLRRGGEDFFPIGLYHVSRASGVTARNRLECLEFAADNGYNLILMATIGENDDNRFMEEAARRGIAVYCDVKTTDTIAVEQDRWSAVVSWMHELDEPEHWGYSRDDVLRRADDIYRLDPQGVIFSSMETASTIVSYAGVSDLMATTGYPIPYNPLRLVFDKMKLLTEMAEKYMFVPIATIQSFGYPRPEDSAHGYPGLPTPQQIRNMTYQALLTNIRGIQYYTYADGAFTLDDYPELYECMRHIPEEIRFAVPFLRGGAFTRLETGDVEIEGGHWRLPGRELTVYVNLTAEARPLRLSRIPAGTVGCFGSREATAAEITMTPYEVIIWSRETL